MLPVFKPILPTAECLIPVLARIDANQYYTNHGPLVVDFESRLASACGVRPDQVVTSSSCTMALAQALRARLTDDITEDALCIVPSWTFVATPAAVLLARLRPYFADVSANTWALEPEHVASLAARLRSTGKTVAAVMPVAPFGALLDLEQWEKFEKDTGISVVIDAAASFDVMTGAEHALGSFSSHIPIAVSLHATKVFGIGEGGFVLSSDAELIKRIRKYGNFGFYGSREASVAGWNAKLGEMYAAVGLVLFDQWPIIRGEWQALTEHFCHFSKELEPNARIPAVMESGWVSTYGLLQLSRYHPELGDIIKEMGQHGVEARQWWSSGCHLQKAYRRYGREALPNTEYLAGTVLGMPFWRQMDQSDMVRALTVLQRLLLKYD
jgi:dTDP-4-amino-4,6-dideoxygalactose transaminase